MTKEEKRQYILDYFRTDIDFVVLVEGADNDLLDGLVKTVVILVGHQQTN